MPSRRAAVVMLVTYPRPGEVLPRIGAALGDDAALALHDRLARHTLRALLELQRRHEARAWVRCDAGFTGAAREWLGRGPRYRYQGDGDQGHRMVVAFSRGFGWRVERVIVVGADCAALSADRLREALRALDTHDAVVGPATDGGCYLIGLSRSAKDAVPALLERLPWGSSDLAVQARHSAAHAGLTVAELEPLELVGSADDVPAAEALLRDSESSAERPRRLWSRTSSGAKRG